MYERVSSKDVLARKVGRLWKFGARTWTAGYESEVVPPPSSAEFEVRVRKDGWGREESIKEEPSHEQTVETASSKGGDEAASFAAVGWRTLADPLAFYRIFF